MATLTGKQYKTLYNALQGAFDYDKLQRLLRFELDQSLDQIASKYENMENVLFNVIGWAERQGRIAELIAAVKEARPQHQAIQALPTTFGTTSASDPLLAYHKQIVTLLSGDRYQIDRRFVRLTLLLDQGEDAHGGRWMPDPQRRKYDDLRLLLSEIDEHTLVLLGRPGSGKTTLLRRLQLEYAWDALEDPDKPIPFFISLNGFRSEQAETPLSWLQTQWQIRHPHLPPLADLFYAGRLLLLLDGLNEMPHRDRDDYRARIGRWQTFLRETHHHNNTVIFTCRSLDYSAALNSDFAPVRQVDVNDLTPAQMEAYLVLHLGAERGQSVWQTLAADTHLRTLFAAPFFLRLLADQVAATGSMPTGQTGLLTNFVRHTLRREIERNQRLFQPNALLSGNDIHQVVNALWPTATTLPEDGVLLPKLAALAYGMQAGRVVTAGGQVKVPEVASRELVGHERAADIITAGIQLNVLDKEVATREIAFYHQLLQEYFAARVVAAQFEPQRVATAWHVDAVQPTLEETVAGLALGDPLPPLPTTGWEETVVLATALTADPNRWVEAVSAVNLPVAARCMLAPEVQVDPALRTRIQTELLARIGDEQADLRARIAAAQALGELGDPRFERRTGVHGAYLWPPFVAVQGGDYVIGDDDGRYEAEKPAHTVTLEPFALAAFPVTNAEYALFIEAGGYEDERWWQTAAARAWVSGEMDKTAQKHHYWKRLINPLKQMTEKAIRKLPNVTPQQMDLWLWFWHTSEAEIDAQLDQWFPASRPQRHPEYWEDNRFNHPAHPVVGISWFEAHAYCAWLAAQSGESVGLPNEAQWEAAARGARVGADSHLPTGRPYGFEGAYDNSRCNTFETHIHGTTPIGVFPAGKTPEGIYDLSGNVWEWTSSHYKPYPYSASDGREDAEDGNALRTLLGGSWFDGQDACRAAYRYWYAPYRRYSAVGFRLAVRNCPPQGR